MSLAHKTIISIASPQKQNMVANSTLHSLNTETNKHLFQSDSLKHIT